MSKPLVSVITPTWRRPKLLTRRCIPSVQAQDYPLVEHVIVADGPAPDLAEKLGPIGSYKPERHPVIFAEYGQGHDGPLAENQNGTGARIRSFGTAIATGELITYLDDDDKYRANHIRVLAEALERFPDAGFAYSQMLSHNATGEAGVIGGAEPVYCGIGSPMIMHRREVLDYGAWGPDSDREDWEIVERWLKAGIKYVHVPQVTVDVWPSVFFGHGDRDVT